MKKIMFNDKFGLTKAVLEGKKTMTRRIITCPRQYKGKEVRGFYVCKNSLTKEVTEVVMYDEDERMIDGGQIFPKYKVGEVVAIAQSYETVYHENIFKSQRPNSIDGLGSPGWTNKMFVCADLMPYAIKITDVKVERLQDISQNDCLQEGIFKHISHAKVYYMHEGIGNYFFETPRHAFASLIARVSGKGIWDSNPWVYAYNFEVINNQIC